MKHTSTNTHAVLQILLVRNWSLRLAVAWHEPHKQPEYNRCIDRPHEQGMRKLASTAMKMPRHALATSFMNLSNAREE